MHKKACAIVPAFNEEGAIDSVIADLNQHQPAIDVVVVNDGSSDRTADIARTAGATVLSLAANLGIGGAVQTGFKYARNHDYDTAIQFDGDGQHLASEIDRLLQPLSDNKADVVIGSRFLTDDGFRSTLMRRSGIRTISAVNRLLTGHRIYDCTSGFRAYNRRAITWLADNYPQDYPEPQSVVQLLRRNFRVLEVPVRMQARTSGRSSIGFRHSLYYITTVLLSNIIGESGSGEK